MPLFTLRVDASKPDDIEIAADSQEAAIAKFGTILGKQLSLARQGGLIPPYLMFEWPPGPEPHRIEPNIGVWELPPD